MSRLEEYEENVQKSYDVFSKYRSSDYFATLYNNIKDLTTEVLTVGNYWKNYDMDMEEVIYTYTLYLIDRLATKKFIPELNGRDKFAWSQYIRLNVRHIVHKTLSGPKYEPITDALKECMPEFIKNGESNAISNTVVEKYSRYIKMIYGDKFYVLANILLSTKLKRIDLIRDPELKDFSRTCWAVYRRLHECYDASGIAGNMSNTINSTLYIATLLSSSKDTRLFIALDLVNLYRLSLMFGGDSIRVPYLAELDELVHTARCAYELLIAKSNNLSIEEAGRKVKKNFSLPVRSDVTSKNVLKLLSFLHTNIIDKASDDLPLVDNLIALSNGSVEIVEAAMNKLLDKISTTDDPNKMLEIYKESISMVGKVTNVMDKIHTLVGSPKEKVA